MKKRTLKTLITCILVITSPVSLAEVQTLPKEADTSQQVTQYIEHTWDTLTRSNQQLAISRADPKIPSDVLYIYLAKDESLTKVKHELFDSLPPEMVKKVKLDYLPSDISKINHHGLLYLPNPYVVPGGRFNEMYGWDSYFITLGLLKDGRNELAKNMIENLVYEINHYGTILNANRTYDLQRSQPPLLTEMILAYYDKTKDKAWLATTLPAINKLYQFWMTAPHYIPGIGLSRYYAGGEGAAPEESPSYYQKVIDYYKKNSVVDYDKDLYFNEKTNKLTPLFYIADRTVRESGLDITAKYGPFGAAILDYAPVDLNVLLYQMEKDTSSIYRILNNENKVKEWEAKAQTRGKRINQYLWNDSLGYYFDYNFKTKQLRPYVYATTFYPLWAGVASKEQAEEVVENLPSLLAEGGIVTSTYRPKAQWDAPFGWAPIQYFAVKGLERYGYNDLAREVAKRFINTVNKGFNETHQLYEKYDVQSSSTQTGTKINYGYSTNEIGFGWTNGVYLELISTANML